MLALITSKIRQGIQSTISEVEPKVIFSHVSKIAFFSSEIAVYFRPLS